MVALEGKVDAGENVKDKIADPPFIQLLSLLQSVNDSVDIHRQSFHCWRISGCLCVHSRGKMSKQSAGFFTVIRAASSMFSDILQVYPTATRALGLGTSSGMARVGALITPFVAQVTLSVFLFKIHLHKRQR